MSRFRRIQERDKKWLLRLDVARLNKVMFRLMVVLIVLSFTDLVLTIAAYSTGPYFVELNLLASALFGRQFLGFVAAILLKYAVLVPIVYGVLVKDRPDRPVQIRTVKLAVFVALVAANVVYGVIVAWNSYTLATFMLTH